MRGTSSTWIRQEEKHICGVNLHIGQTASITTFQQTVLLPTTPCQNLYFSFSKTKSLEMLSNVSSAGNRKVENCQREMSAFTTWLSLPLLFFFLFLSIKSCKFKPVQRVCLGKAMLGYHGDFILCSRIWRSTEENDK